MRIDPKLIIDFATIAEEGSFTRAAQRLRVAQPWLSARLRKLEDILGFRLIERTTRTLALTERGADFLVSARAVAQACNAADKAALQLGRLTRSVLRVGAAPYTRIIRRRRNLLDGFVRAYPDVSLELETGWSQRLLERLHQGEIDLTFLMGDGDERFEGQVLGRMGLSLTLALSHPLAASAAIRPHEAAAWPIEVYTRNLYPDLWDQLYAPLIEAGAELIEIAEMAEGSPDRMDNPDHLAAFFDFGADEPDGRDVVRIPVISSVSVPFQLLRRREPAPSENCTDLWAFARDMIRTER